MVLRVRVAMYKTAKKTILIDITVTANTEDLKYLFSKRQLTTSAIGSDLQCLAIKRTLTDNLFQTSKNSDYLGYGNALIFDQRHILFFVPRPGFLHAN